MAQRIQVRRGLSTDGASVVFAAGEPFFFTDTGELGIGDGTTPGGRIFALVPIHPLPSGGYVPAYTTLAALQAISTDDGDMPIGAVIPGLIAGIGVQYVLQANGTGAQPNDYQSITNNVSWHQIS